jgi:simple sugar transport system ATP-binding protein
MAPVLELIAITKRFGAVTALDGVSLSLLPGTVHGLLGENGAGKSTLMNVAYGLIAADAGQIRVTGKAARFGSPRDAIAAGIGMVHQHFMLAGAMTVLDNVLLGDRRAGRMLDRSTAAEMLEKLAASLGLPVNPHARVQSLSVGEQQRVEILKALWRNVRILILDEPTAVLTPQEVEQLFAAIERLRMDGKTIVFISHKLGEVTRICDHVTVLRRGKVVWEGDAKDASAQDLARHMVGRELNVIARQTQEAPHVPSATHPMLALDEVSTGRLARVSFEIPAATILGIAGVDGNGQQELAEVVVGLRRTTKGHVFIAGQDATRLSLKHRLRLGVAHIPNDRKREALVATMTVAENLALKIHDRPPLARAGVISRAAMRNLAKDLAQRFDVRAASVDTPVGTLSGGNQQKVVLARELAIVEPRLIVAMNPARGLDVAATRFVYDQLLARRTAGCAILLISSELDEILSLCDRVAVIYNGRVTMTDFPNTTRQEIGRLMAGVAN